MRRLAVPGAAVVLLVLAAGLAGLGTLGLAEREQDPLFGQLEITPRGPALEPDLPDAAGPEPEPEPETGLDWVGDVILVLAGAGVLAGLVLAVRAVRRALARRPAGRGRLLRLRPLPPPAAAAPGVEPDQQLLAALDAGLGALSDDDRDPRRAVIACWLRLEEVATAAGVPRYSTDTAGDLVVRLLRTRQVSEPALAGLAEAYRLARYAASRAVDEQTRTGARTALQRLREELRAPVPGGVP